VQQFFAILKDSFREAVDGFVIYVMLAMAALVALVVASVSFTPDPAEKALPGVLKMFFVIFPDKGKSAAFTGVSQKSLEYTANKTEESADGTIRFALNVKAKEDEKERSGAQVDTFRYSVFAWSKPAGEKIKNPFGQNKGKAGDDRKIEIVVPPEATATDLQNVRDEDMVGFLKSQFAAFIGVSESNVTVARRTEGVAEPNYRFDVELKGATTARGWPQTFKVFFNQVSLGDDWKLGSTVYLIEDWLVGWIGGTVTLLLSVIITAFFIPNMLRKGSIDLLISKPIGRAQLLIYKYVGGLTFIFILTTFTVGTVWVGLSMRAGYWDPTFLIMIPSLTFSFAILYAISTAVAVLTRSAIASILITVAFMFLLFLVGKAKEYFDINRVFEVVKIPDWGYTVVDVLHAILPRYKDLDRLTAKLLVETNLPPGEARMGGVGLIEYPSWGGAVGVSLVFIAVMLALACWKLNKRDN
jgi:ABC-type transport system involved in multi-copper enzyme maturation permease subunit